MTSRPSAAAPLPLPSGFTIRLDPAARELAPGIWFGGSPARIIRLTEPGQTALRELAAGPVATATAGALARRLTDAQLAHPVPPGSESAGGPDQRDRRPDVTVVIPARDRAALLERCLAGLDPGYPVIVVDDGSADPAAIAAAAARHDATLIRRPANGGPAAARNTALAHVRTELVAFVDSDCVPAPGWIEALAAHFADPLAGAVAPRVTALAPATWPGRYTAACGPLDLGARPARVRPGGTVAYVPTAALLVRRAALTSIARDDGVFDEHMRSGEDVDLVWRLHEAGWRVRYDPSVRVAHHEPDTWAGLLARRFRYGTSAAPLTRRHPGDVPPLVLHPWPAMAVAAALGRRPAVAAAAYAASVLTVSRTLDRAGVPHRGTARAMLSAAGHTYLGAGRYATQFAAPVLAAAIAATGRRTGARSAAGGGKPAGSRRVVSRRAWRRLAAASLLLAPPLAAWAGAARSGPRELDPVRFTLGRIAYDIAYGLGVWSGCRAERTTAPVRPRVSWRPVRTGTERRTESR